VARRPHCSATPAPTGPRASTSSPGPRWSPRGGRTRPNGPGSTSASPATPEHGHEGRRAPGRCTTSSVPHSAPPPQSMV
jgi:hypothetical protein